MKPIIKVENLSKQYRIDARVYAYPTLREKLAEMIESPLKHLRNQRRAVGSGCVWALKDVSFEVHPSEVVGIVGRNGSGKSTLLKTLSNITQPTAGHIELYGRSSSLLEVGTGFHPELSGRDNVYLNGAILGMSRAEIRQHFDEIVAFAEVDEFLDTAVKYYSTGMYVRLAFAVAAHLRTEILFIDEVLAVGDLEFQRKCLGKVAGLAREGRTVLFVSHNLSAVTRLCERSLWLNGGHLESDGNSRDVVAEYCSLSYTEKHSWERLPENGASSEQQEIYLCSVRLCQGERQGTGVVSFDEDFTAEIKYEVKKAIAFASLVLRIASDSGTIIFTSNDTDSPTQNWVPSADFGRDERKQKGRTRLEGRYLSVCKIPGKLLRSGNFLLTFGIRKQGIWIELHENLVTFEVSAVGNPINPRRPGVITPVLDWDERKLD
ncbi:MAG: ABC transporter ATP-binding protein [Acidobacteriota bacterium]|nr:ABC transporter ATP-binding protein [Acidobacteriota bacterium]